MQAHTRYTQSLCWCEWAGRKAVISLLCSRTEQGFALRGL
jgi:hypothetical protein